MAEKTGILKICDRCGEQIFLELIEKEVLDCGITYRAEYEAPPKGWQWHADTGYLCPQCNAEYIELLRNFKGDKNEENSNTIQTCI